MSTTNLLEVENPDEYGCNVESYRIGHSEVWVTVRHMNNQEQFYAHFHHVWGFCGTMRWNGAILRLGSDEEYLQFTRQMIPLADESDERILNPEIRGQLYIFDGDHGSVRLIASNFSKRDSRI